MKHNSENLLLFCFCMYCNLFMSYCIENSERGDSFL